MALPSSGAISLNDVNVELGLSGTATISMNDSAVRTLFGVASGGIGMANGYGKSDAFKFSITSNQNKANLRSLAVAAGWDQSKKVVATLNSGVYIYSDAIGTAALTIDGSWPGGLTFVNNGFVMGMGGTGGSVYFDGSTWTQNFGQSAGGNAINLGVSCTIENNSYIGGGGGGGGSSNYTFSTGAMGGGGGAGGGDAGTYNDRGAINPAPAAGGALGSAGSNGINQYAGGGGGRIMPGTNTVNTITAGTPSSTATSIGGGANNAGSSSGSGASTSGTIAFIVGQGGTGGGTGPVAAGYGYGAFIGAGGGGGGYGASGGPSYAGYAGAAGGKCANLNGFTITWSVAGNRYGAIS